MAGEPPSLCSAVMCSEPPSPTLFICITSQHEEKPALLWFGSYCLSPPTRLEWKLHKTGFVSHPCCIPCPEQCLAREGSRQHLLSKAGKRRSQSVDAWDRPAVWRGCWPCQVCEDVVLLSGIWEGARSARGYKENDSVLISDRTRLQCRNIVGFWQRLGELDHCGGRLQWWDIVSFEIRSSRLCTSLAVWLLLTELFFPYVPWGQRYKPSRIAVEIRDRLCLTLAPAK